MYTLDRKELFFNSAPIINFLVIKMLFDYFELHGTIYGKILIGVGFLVAFVIGYFYMKYRKEQGLSVIPTGAIIPAVFAFCVFAYIVLNKPF